MTSARVAAQRTDLKRVDARRNREKILRVAEDAFCHGEEPVPLEEIARRAQLGRATVYRHFPDRHSLGLAVAGQQVAAFRGVVKCWEAERRSFRELLTMVLTSQVSHRPMVHFLHELPFQSQQQHADAVVEILTAPFRRAQAEQQLRMDVQPTDLLLVFDMMESAISMGNARRHVGDPVERVIRVIVDGFFAVHPRLPNTATSAV